MPVYQYTCDCCGPFQATAPLSAFDAPQDCPICGAASPRNLLSTPQLSTVSAHARRAHGINERAADSPKRAKDHGLTPSGPRINRNGLQRADGSKSFPTNRPWMLSH